MKGIQFLRTACVTASVGSMLGLLTLSSGATLSAQLPDSTMSRDVASATGCVERESPGEKTAGGGSLDGAFMLRGVRVGPSMGLSERPWLPPTSPGTPAGSESSQAARRDGLRLVGERGVDLAEHVGHRVLVTGRLSSFAAPGGVASTASGRTLTVTTVSLISAGCTTGS